MYIPSFQLSKFNRSYVADDGQNPLDFRDLTNSYWVTIITMLTVGFGDGYPSTHLGRFIGVIACILGMLLTSLILVALTTITEFIPEEAKVFFPNYPVDESAYSRIVFLHAPKNQCHKQCERKSC